MQTRITICHITNTLKLGFDEFTFGFIFKFLIMFIRNIGLFVNWSEEENIHIKFTVLTTFDFKNNRNEII